MQAGNQSKLFQKIADSFGVERRKEPRIPLQQTVRLTLLKLNPQEEKTIEAILLNASGRGMRLELSIPLDIDSPVRIDAGKQVILGEICYCNLQDSGRYVAGLICSQRMEDKDLYQLYRILMREGGEPARSPDGVPTIHSEPA